MAIRPIKIVISGANKTSVAFREATESLSHLGEKINKINEGLGGLLGGAALSEIGIKLSEKLGLTELPGEIVKNEAALVRMGNRFPLLARQAGSVREAMERIAEETGNTRTELQKGLPPLLAEGTGFNPSNVHEPLRLAAKLAKAYEGTVEEAALSERSLVTEMKVAPDLLKKSFSELAVSTENTTINMGDLIRAFPALAQQAGLLGIRGTRGIAQIGAMLGVVSQSTHSTDEAIMMTQSLLEKVVSKRALTQFQKLKEAGIADFFTPIFKAQSQGKDVLEEFAKVFQKITKGKTEAERTALVNALGLKGNADAILNLIDHIDRYKERRDSAAQNDNKINEDYDAAIQNLGDQWDIFKEKVQARVRPGMTSGLEKLNSLLEKLSGSAHGADAALAGIGVTLTAGVGLTVVWAAKKFKQIADALKVIADIGKHGPGGAPATPTPIVTPKPAPGASLFESLAGRAGPLAARLPGFLNTGIQYAKGAVGAALPGVLLNPVGVGEGSTMFDPRTHKTRVQEQMDRFGMFGPPILPRGAGGGDSAQISVRFENLPPGATVSTRGSVPGLSIEHGRAFEMAH